MTDTDSQWLQEARGFFTLGMWAECAAILDKLPATSFNVIELRIQLQVEQRSWTSVRRLAQEMIDLYPAELYGFIQRAFAFRELNDFEGALMTLKFVPTECLEKADTHLRSTYFFNLACYQALTGAPREAEGSLTSALSIDPKLIEDARKDPDLESIRPFLSNW